MIGIVLDIGNVIFFISNLPQLITAYKNRTNLKGLSAKMLFGFICSTIFFVMAGGGHETDRHYYDTIRTRRLVDEFGKFDKVDEFGKVGELNVDVEVST